MFVLTTSIRRATTSAAATAGAAAGAGFAWGWSGWPGTSPSGAVAAV